jgi:hypothetical protein
LAAEKEHPMSICIEIPWLPPSSNNAYFNLPRGGRALTTEGRKFLNETKAHLVQAYPREMRIFQPNKPYLIYIQFYFQLVENRGFATGKAESRYKKFDGGNRIKLLEDALKDAGGVDDSQTLCLIWRKQVGEEHTRLQAWSTEEEATPFDNILRTL